MSLLLLVAALAVAGANGANDSFKGVATLWGSRTTGYRTALVWALLTTAAGALVSLLLAQGLLAAFSGKGLVPPTVVADPGFLAAVGCGAALTVAFATRLGLPISTTHALVGGLIGAGLAAGGPVNAANLGGAFLLPLALGPILGFLIARLIYPALRAARLRLGVQRELCLCVGSAAPVPVALAADGSMRAQSSGAAFVLADPAACEERYLGRIAVWDAQRFVDRSHFLSAGLVGFARGLNDAPKIAALAVAAAWSGIGGAEAVLVITVAMTLGGLLAARRVAITMSERIAPLSHGQGFAANAVTAALVGAASLAGLPVSTTHVSCGAIAGVGTVGGGARWAVLRRIGAAWLLTLPLAAALAAATGALVIHVDDAAAAVGVQLRPLEAVIEGARVADGSNAQPGVALVAGEDHHAAQPEQALDHAGVEADVLHAPQVQILNRAREDAFLVFNAVVGDAEDAAAEG